MKKGKGFTIIMLHVLVLMLVCVSGCGGGCGLIENTGCKSDKLSDASGEVEYSKCSVSGCGGCLGCGPQGCIWSEKVEKVDMDMEGTVSDEEIHTSSCNNIYQSGCLGCDESNYKSCSVGYVNMEVEEANRRVVFITPAGCKGVTLGCNNGCVHCGEGINHEDLVSEFDYLMYIYQ